MQRYTGRRRPCERGGRVWNYATIARWPGANRTWKRRGRNPPQNLWGGDAAPSTLCFLISHLQTVGEYVPLVISYPVSCNLWWQPRTLVQCPLLLTMECGDLGFDFSLVERLSITKQIFLRVEA